MYLLTVRITEAFGLPKLSLFCNVQRDVTSLPSYIKLNLKCDSWEVMWYLTSCLLVVINHVNSNSNILAGRYFWCETLPSVGNMLGICRGICRMLFF